MSVISDGTGRSYAAKVDPEGRLYVKSLSEPLQHKVSHSDSRAFQVRGSATPVAGETTVLHLFNDYEDRDLAVTYIRVQPVALSGGAALPSSLNYFKLSTGRTRVSGGTATEPVNMHFGSSVTASSVACYEAEPTMTGVSKSIDHFYPVDSSQGIYRKEGSLIIGPKAGFEISYVGDQTAGLLEARVSFLMLTEED